MADENLIKSIEAYDELPVGSPLLKGKICICSCHDVKCWGEMCQCCNEPYLKYINGGMVNIRLLAEYNSKVWASRRKYKR